MSQEEEGNLHDLVDDQRNNPRDSGDAVSFQHDKTINKSSCSKNENNQELLEVIEEEEELNEDNSTQVQVRSWLKSSPLPPASCRAFQRLTENEERVL